MIFAPLLVSFLALAGSTSTLVDEHHLSLRFRGSSTAAGMANFGQLEFFLPGNPVSQVI